MSYEQSDVGVFSRRLSEIFYDQALGDVSASEPEIKETFLATEDQKRHEPKYGDCYIFDYQTFRNGSPERLGSEKDVARLRHDFSELNFNVYSNYLDYSKKRTLDTLKEAARKVPVESKCFICCFLTHGDNGKLLMNDKYLDIEEILKCFSRSACKNLAGKPKIFIFQACRGRCCEEGVPCDSTDSGSEACRGHCCEEGVPCDSTDSGSEVNLPDYLDFLLVYSTYEGQYSFKTKDDKHLENNHGSFFIDELCRTLEQFSEKLDLLKILTIVNFRIAHFYLSSTLKEETDKKKQMPGFTSRLTTEVKFNKSIKPFVTVDTKFFDTRRGMSRLGKTSTEKPSSDEQIYNIQNERTKFLFLINTEKKIENKLNECASYLWSSIAAKGWQRDRQKNWSIKKATDFLTKVAVQDCSNTDCLICFVACQGKGDYMLDNKGNKFLKQRIIEQFTGKACKELRGKPKIFVFLVSSPPKKFCWPIVFADSTDGCDDNLIPVHSDLLEVTITIQDVEQLEGVMKKLNNIFGIKSSEDFISQLTKMNDELVKDFEFYSPMSKGMATFSLYSTLTETLILN